MSGERWTKPKKPNQRLIEQLHRSGTDPDAGVTFAINIKASPFGEQATGFRPLVTIPRSELSQWFPELVEQLAEDSYFSINSFWIARDKRTKKARPSRAPELEYLPYPAQRAEHARRLNACYADLDVYNVDGLDPETAFAVVMRMANDEGSLPCPSLFVNSGRGLWPLWLLRDNRNPNESPPAFPSLQSLYRRINRAITSRLKKLGSDSAAIDVSRFLRVPGSINSKGKKRRVAYLLAADDDGNSFTYTLEELANFFGLQRPRITEATRELAEGDPSAKLKGHRGSLGRWTRELQRFELLRELRAGNPPAFQKGQRSRALRFYAGLLVRVRSAALAFEKRGGKLTPLQEPVARMTDAEIHDAVRRLVGQCARDAEDPITSSHANSAVRTAIAAGGIGGEFNPTHQTIADWFRITPDEAERLPRSNLGPFPHFMGADGSQRRDGPESSRADLAQQRRELIRRYVAGNNDVPTLRAIRAMLNGFGLQATPRTITKDLKALSIENPRGLKAKKAELERAQLEAAPLFNSVPGSEPGPALGSEPSDQMSVANPATKPI